MWFPDMEIELMVEAVSCVDRYEQREYQRHAVGCWGGGGIEIPRFPNLALFINLHVVISIHSEWRLNPTPKFKTAELNQIDQLRGASGYIHVRT